MSVSAPVPKEAVLVINAHSRKGRELFREAVEKLRATGIHLISAHAIRKPKLMTPTVQEAVRSGAPMVIVGGGDGSLSCAVDELVDRDCVFALLPLGTANSFARTLGIPLDLDGAIDTIANGRRRRVDLGVIDGDYFANSAAIGLAPLVSASVPAGCKKYLGRTGYLMWALYQMARFRGFRLKVEEQGGETHELEALEVRIANGSFHGGVEVVEEAEVDSGEIFIQAVIGNVKRQLAWNWAAAGRRRNISECSATATAKRRRKPSVAEKKGLRVPSVKARPPAIRMMSGAPSEMRSAGARRPAKATTKLRR